MKLFQALLALIAGALITLSLSPFDLWPLAWLSPAILFTLIRNKNAKQAFWLGWAYGVGLFGAGVSWIFISISEHSTTPVWLALSLTAAFVTFLGLLLAVQATVFSALFSRKKLNWLAFAALWVGFEWLRSWLFTGFPWLYLGYATIDTPLVSWAAIGGIWLNSLWVCAGACAVISLFTHSSVTEKLFGLTWVLAPWLALSQLPAPETQVANKSAKVMLVQPNIAQELKWQPSQLNSILEQYINQSLEQVKADIIVWPETAIPALFRTSAAQLTPLLDQLDQQNISLISGMPTAIPDRDARNGYRIHNSIAVLSAGEGLYHKQRLVPFGEYLPLESYLRGTIDFFNLPASSFSLPEEAQKLLKSHGYKVSSAICYEIAYPELVRISAKDADFMLTISNDTWFGRSIAPDQHLQIARMRAVENGRWLIRNTNNGISAIIDPNGKIKNIAPRYQQATLQAEVWPISGQTLFQRYGSQPLLILLCILLALGLLQEQRQLKSYRQQVDY